MFILCEYNNVHQKSCYQNASTLLVLKFAGTWFHFPCDYKKNPEIKAPRR